MKEWNGIINEALLELKADEIYTRGAILHNKVSQIAKSCGLDLDQYLKETKQKFSSAIQNLENNVEIHKRPNTDMYVGLPGATWPSSAVERERMSRNRIRADVYEAFTRISDSDYWYLLDTDEFRKDVSHDYPGKKIAVPSATLESLLKQRRSFAEESEAPEELIKAIERSANPLAAFQTEIYRLRLGLAWHNFKTSVLKESIQEWADQNSIAFNPQWVEPHNVEQHPQTPQQLMATFATFMTDDEVRSISVPFRAVEAMYRSIGESKG